MIYLIKLKTKMNHPYCNTRWNRRPSQSGAIIRTADVLEYMTLYQREDLHKSMRLYIMPAGAVEHVLVAKVNNINNAIDDPKDKGM